MKMNKKLLASLIAVGIMTTGTAFAAANPFDDVPKGHWSYDAVQTLADQGIVDGFGDGTFRGDKLMTRYEMAQIVGKAISKGKLAGVGSEGKSTIERLSAEYADELSNLGVRVAKVEKETSGVKDLKITHWFQTENTYGDTTQASGDKGHEYELEYRLGVEKQVNPKTSMFMQLETKAYYDDKAYADEGRDGLYTRLAYVTYKPSDKVTVVAGKNAYWVAGGLLGDDYIQGIDVTAKLDDKTTLELLHGRYWVDQYSHGSDSRGQQAGNDKAQITYAGLNTKFGIVDFGAHYMYGQQALNSVGYSNFTDGAYNPSTGKNEQIFTGEKDLYGDRETNIWALTGGVNLWDSGINLSAGYAENTEQDNNNKLAKIQLYKKMGKADVFAQYWKQQGLIDLPMENGNHMAWWGDMFTGGWGDHRGNNGVEGYRLIAVYPWSDHSYSEFFYGDYKDLVTDEKSQKFGWSLTFQY